MKDEKINTPEELMAYMNENILYGFVDSKGKIYTPSDEKKFQNGCRNIWKLSSPERLKKVRYGHCWDQVEFEREWFLNHGYECKTFYIWFELDYDNPYSTHTYLIYKEDGKYKLFEHSDYQNRGIYEFDCYIEAVNYQKQKFIEYNKNQIKENEMKHLTIYEYNRPKYNISMSEFIDYIMENGTKINE